MPNGWEGGGSSPDVRPIFGDRGVKSRRFGMLIVDLSQQFTDARYILNVRIAFRMSYGTGRSVLCARNARYASEGDTATNLPLPTFLAGNGSTRSARRHRDAPQCYVMMCDAADDARAIAPKHLGDERADAKKSS